MDYLETAKYYDVETAEGPFSGHLVRADLDPRTGKVKYVFRTAGGEVPLDGDDIENAAVSAEQNDMEWGMSEGPALEILPAD